MKETVSKLDEIREVFGLSRSEIADFLGGRAQSLIEWETRGIPFVEESFPYGVKLFTLPRERRRFDKWYPDPIPG